MGTISRAAAEGGVMVVRLPFSFCLPSQWGSILEGKNLFSGRKFFSIRLDPISEWLCHPQIEKQTVVPLCKNGRKH